MKYLAPFLVLFGLLMSYAPAPGHDHKRPDLDGWYPKLHSKAGTWCCDGPKKDALHLRDTDWENKGGKYRVRIPADIDAFQDALQGKLVPMVWVDVDDGAVIEQPNLDGSTLVWPTYGYEGPKARCFLPGSMT